MPRENPFDFNDQHDLHMAYASGHYAARGASLESAIAYDAIVKESGILLSELAAELGEVGSDGWCRGDVHGDDLKKLKDLLNRINRLNGVAS